MLFNILILLACAAIIFVHYLRGLFSGIISAILAIFAAVFALSYYEPLTERFLAGKFANTAHAMMLLMLFAVIYLVLRLIFDKAVPGNVRVPGIADKIGGALMGAVAAIFAVGPVAIAGQMLPFGPAPGSYAKYPVTEKNPVIVPQANGGRKKSAATYDELRTDKTAAFADDEAERQYLIMGPLSPDEVLVSLTEHLSDGGALSRRPMRDFHPDLLQELFGQRLGIQTGARRVLMNNPEKAIQKAFSSVELFECKPSPFVADFDYADFRKKRSEDVTRSHKIPANPTSDMLLVVRVMLTRNAGDPDDFMFRFSTGSVRLVASGVDGPRDYHPYGFMNNAGTLVVTKLDDFLFVNLHEGDKGVDFAFVIDRKAILPDGQGKGPVLAKAGTFIEINRMAREDLSGKEIKSVGLPPLRGEIEVMRKAPLKVVDATPTPPTPTTPVQPAPTAASKAKLIGAWTGGDGLVLEFHDNGELAYSVKGVGGTGTWAVTSETPAALSITRTVKGSATPATITFDSDDAINYTSQSAPPMKMTRRK